MTIFRDLARSRIFWALVITAVTFWGLVSIVGHAQMVTIANAVGFIAAVAVAATYAPAAWITLRAGRGNDDDYLIFGIVVSWIADSGIRAWTAAFRIIGRPEWMLDHPILSFFLMWRVVAAILHMTAPNAINGRVPQKNWIKVGAIIACGLGLSAGLLWIGLSSPSE